MAEPTSASVLVVDDDERVVRLFRRWLEDEYTVYTATSGEEALYVLEDEDVDVVLLDRRMPSISGDDVLAAINDRGIDCEVAMVTAVQPDFDIIQMEFDDYVVKPPTRDGLRQTVENLLDRRQYSKQRQKYWSLLSKQAALETEKSESELAEDEDYADLQAEIDTLADELEESHERMGEDAEFLSTLQEIESRSNREER